MLFTASIVVLYLLVSLDQTLSVRVSLSLIADRLHKRQAVRCPGSGIWCASTRQCISRYDICDGVSNCPDNSDETADACISVSIYTCPSTSFRCEYGACIDRKKRCNGVSDCNDGSDEEASMCGTSTAPTSSCRRNSDFSCTTGNQCVSRYVVCDGGKDCKDGSDETAESCAFVNIFTCPAQNFRCSYGACITMNKRCDGSIDCSDGSDEEPIMCGRPVIPSTSTGLSTTLSSNRNSEFSCKTGVQSVSRYVVCDGAKDCTDGSDETAEACTSVNIFTCPDSNFRCNYGACITKSKRCDGSIDCSDGSDEDPSICGTSSGCRCQSWQWCCTSGTCIPENQHCDGRQDCRDGSDEVNCPTPSTTQNVPLDNACLLPKPAMNMVFTDSTCTGINCRLSPGQSVADNKLVSISCAPGYQLKLNYLPSEVYTRCKEGQWTNTIPQCTKPCTKPVNPSMDLTCTQGSLQGCDRPLLPGTILKYACKVHYQNIISNQPNILQCLPSGEWSGVLPTCKPQCGQSNLVSTAETTIIDGKVSELGYFPWHAGLYRLEDNRWRISCGGSLINTHFVLTAAHCVTPPTRTKVEVISESSMMVVFGRYYHDLYREEERTEVRVSIRKVIVHEDYRGEPQLYRNDIALLELTNDVPISSYVMPVCVDYQEHHTLQVSQDKTLSGYVAGWGNTAECENIGHVCDTLSPTLVYTQVPLLGFPECYERTQQILPNAVSKLTDDKYCTGNGTVSKTQQGDSGGGHTFDFGGAHYIFGIVSTKIKGTNRPSKVNYNFGTMTNVSFHMDWLRKNVN